MQLALQPLYTLPVGDHHALTLRLACGRTVDLVLYDGGGVTRSVGVWRMAQRVLGVAIAGQG